MPHDDLVKGSRTQRTTGSLRPKEPIPSKHLCFEGHQQKCKKTFKFKTKTKSAIWQKRRSHIEIKEL